MSLSAIIDQYADAADLLPGAADLSEHRRAALQRFGELGLPTKKSETWRYTDLTELASKPLNYVAGYPESQTLAAAKEVLRSIETAKGSPVCTFVDGHLINELSSFRNSDKISITAMPEASDELIGTAPDTALESLNTAFASAGVLIRLSGSAATPVQLVFLSSGGNLAQQLKLAIRCEAGSNTVVHQHFASLPGKGEGWLNLVTDIEQSDSSALRVFRLQQQSEQQVLTSLTRATLAAKAQFEAMNIELGGAIVRNEFVVDLDGRKASTHIAGLALTGNRQHIDTRLDVNHNAPYTTSRQDYRAMAADSSRCVFNGKVTVQKDAQHIEARQRNDNLLLSKQAEIDTKPELEIYADQVICSHGATVGELDDDHLFYLRSRGIDAESARHILTTAFADVILQQIDDEQLHRMAREAVVARLPE